MTCIAVILAIRVGSGSGIHGKFRYFEYDLLNVPTPGRCLDVGEYRIVLWDGAPNQGAETTDNVRG